MFSTFYWLFYSGGEVENFNSERNLINFCRRSLYAILKKGPSSHLDHSIYLQPFCNSTICPVCHLYLGWSCVPSTWAGHVSPLPGLVMCDLYLDWSCVTSLPGLVMCHLSTWAGEELVGQHSLPHARAPADQTGYSSHLNDFKIIN